MKVKEYFTTAMACATAYILTSTDLIDYHRSGRPTICTLVTR